MNEMDEIQRWVLYMKEHPTEWKKKHTAFIDAQFQKHREFLQRLKKQPDGREKICKLYNIKNKKGFEQLLS